MQLPRLWRRRPCPSPAAVRAQVEAENAVRAAHENWLSVKPLADRMKDLRERNHFAQSIEAAYALRHNHPPRRTP